MLRIGFNGKTRAKTTDPEKNPNGEDVNIGWHERMKSMLGGRQIMTDPVVLDAAGDYKSLDSMAQDLINAKIPEQYRNDPRLVVLVGADLVAAEQYRLYQAADRPTEKSPLKCWVQQLPGARPLFRHLCRVSAWSLRR